MPLNLEPFRFLICDDMRDMRITVRAMLEGLQVKHIVEGKSGDEALELLAKHPIDVVLCDYNMGEGRDGQQTLEEARARGLLKPTAAWLMLTAEQALDLVMGAIENKPDDYLVKPINKTALNLRLERVITRKLALRPVESALAAGDYLTAISLCDELGDKYPSIKSEVLRTKVNALLYCGELNQAAEICAGLLAERELPWAMLALGRARLESGNHRQAKMMFAKLIERHPNVMEAYDLLAGIERQQGNGAEAQRIIKQGIEISPRSIRRQQLLGDVAAENGDYAEAARAFERAVAMGEDSFYGRAEDVAGLVYAVMKHKTPDAAMQLLTDIAKRNARKRGGKQGGNWRLTTIESKVLHRMGKKDDAAAAARRALAEYKNDANSNSIASTIELARSCYEVDSQDDACWVISRLVRENFDRPEVLELVQKMFDELEKHDEGAALIEREREAIIKTNNEGVMLAKTGRFDDAQAMLQQAAEELPNNLTVQLNVVQATLMQIQKQGPTNQTRYLAQEHLARASQLAPRSPKVIQMREKLAELTGPVVAKASA